MSVLGLETAGAMLRHWRRRHRHCLAARRGSDHQPGPRLRQAAALLRRRRRHLGPRRCVQRQDQLGPERGSVRDGGLRAVGLQQGRRQPLELHLQLPWHQPDRLRHQLPNLYGAILRRFSRPRRHAPPRRRTASLCRCLPSAFACADSLSLRLPPPPSLARSLARSLPPSVRPSVLH
jgi:hypothetical protein